MRNKKDSTAVLTKNYSSASKVDDNEVVNEAEGHTRSFCDTALRKSEEKVIANTER